MREIENNSTDPFCYQAYLKYMKQTAVLLGADEVDADKDMEDVSLFYFFAWRIDKFRHDFGGDVLGAQT